MIALLFLVLIVSSAPALAKPCDVSASAINFGRIVRQAGEVVRGEVRVRCDRPTRFRLSLSEGHGNYRVRRMRGPQGSRLKYNLYVDAALRRVWGDGLTAGTARLVGRNDGRRSTIVPVYARLVRDQQAHAGQYSDALVIAVEP